MYEFHLLELQYEEINVKNIKAVFSPCSYWNSYKKFFIITR